MRGVAPKRKWEAKKQLSDATRMLTALVTVRRHFNARVTKLDPDLAMQEKSFRGAPSPMPRRSSAVLGAETSKGRTSEIFLAFGIIPLPLSNFFLTHINHIKQVRPSADSRHFKTGILILAADYSHQIGKSAPDALFRKIEPHSSWSEGSKVAWSVVTSEALAEEESSAHTVARSWLNSEIQNGAGRVEKASKLRGLKGENNNLSMSLIQSKSPSISRRAGIHLVYEVIFLPYPKLLGICDTALAPYTRTSLVLVAPYRVSYH